MSYDYQNAFENLQKKVALVAQKYEHMVRERDDARKEIEDLKELLLKKEKENDILKVKIENLTVVTTLFPDRGKAREARTLLSGLVREIDQCIKDLTD
ncbi:MAG: hypothetical protein J1E99_08085 [Muribaculaceae bacterium]|nr:hypothetical protein [Muribaculaceae bacterium]